MQYDKLLEDFANRTRVNLRVIEALAGALPGHAFEVTQLINSMLGLLVFPKEHYFEQIPETPLLELADQGWPVPMSHGALPPAENLRQLIRYMRNAIAHFNIEFLANSEGEIVGVRLWNRKNGRRGRATWQAHYTIDDLRLLTSRFVELFPAHELDEQHPAFRTSALEHLEED
jgi:hypothetical protein